MLATDAKTQKIEPDLNFLWRMKVSEAVCKRDWHNMRSYLFFNVWIFGTQCAMTSSGQNKQLSAVFLCSGCFRSLCAGCWSLSIIKEPSNRCTASPIATASTRQPTPAASCQVSIAVSVIYLQPEEEEEEDDDDDDGGFAELETELQQKPKTFCVTQLTGTRNLWKNTVVLCVNSWVHRLHIRFH